MGNPPGSGGEIDSSQRRQRRASSVPAPTPSPSLPPTPWDTNNGARVSDREPSLRSGRPLPQLAGRLRAVVARPRAEGSRPKPRTKGPAQPGEDEARGQRKGSLGCGARTTQLRGPRTR